MSFNKVAVSRKNTPGWSRLWGQERTMSNSRLVSTAITWTIALTAIYCSIFYVPAYFDINSAIGVSTTQSKIPEKKSSIFSPILDLLKQNRAYMIRGQGMEAQYKVTGNVSGTLVLYTCQSPIILEVFNCNPVDIQEIPLTKTTGRYAVKLNQSGFYGMTIRLDDEEAEFAMIWRRVY